MVKLYKQYHGCGCKFGMITKMCVWAYILNPRPLKGHGVLVYGHMQNLCGLHQLHKSCFITMCLKSYVYSFYVKEKMSVFILEIDDQIKMHVIASKCIHATSLNLNLH